MKRLTFLIAAVSVAVLSFAAGGNITYELNGGVTNDYGWTNKSDMFDAFMYEANPSFEWKTLEYYKQQADPLGAPNIASGLTSCAILNSNAEKWGWLKTYIIAVTDAQIALNPTPMPTKLNSTDDATSAAWRYAVGAFFVDGQRAAWPVSASFEAAGQLDAFMPEWKHGFAGPTTYDGTEDIVLPIPYKEGDSFLGWYDNAAFEGEKITTIEAGTEGDITLYASFGVYIPTCAEVADLGVGVETKAAGVITYINGTVAYIQDASAGLMVEFAAAVDAKAGDKVTIDGTTAAIGDYIKISAATLASKEADKIPTVQSLTLPVLAANAANYMFEYVQLYGLTVKTAGSGVLGLVDADKNTINLITTATVAVDKRINVKAIVTYDNEVVLVADAANVTVLADGLPTDPAVYESLADDKYKLENLWLVSSTMDNLAANRIGIADHVRGMAAFGGKMYFIDRNLKQLTVFDGATGERLEPVKLANYIFTHEKDGVVEQAGTLPFNDIKVDNAGNVLLGNCITSNVGVFQIWKVDLETGEGTLVLEDILADNPDVEALPTLRFDAFGVYGDVDGDAFIMAANASDMEAYKWVLENGELSYTEAVIIETSAPGTLLEGLANPGTAPQIFPLDEDYFYLDGNGTLPTLIDMDGNVIDGFYNTPTSVWAWDTATDRKQGHNGLIEFEVAGEHFFLIASGNTVATPPSTFTLFKWKDANKEFKDIEFLWTFPKAGMGGLTNAYRTAVPSVEVDEDNNIASLYVYTGENGYGVYKFKVDDGSGVVTPNGELIKIGVRGQTIDLFQPMADLTVYSVTGQLLSKTANASSVDVAANGVYILKATTLAGETITQKVLVK